MSNRITRANAVIIAALSLATALIGGCATSMPVGRAATGDKPHYEGLLVKRSFGRGGAVHTCG